MRNSQLAKQPRTSMQMLFEEGCFMKRILDGEECVECGSKDTHKMGFIVTRIERKQRFHCKACGRAWVEGVLK